MAAVAGVLVGPAPPAAVRRWRAHLGTRAAWGRGRANRREGCEAECGTGRGSVQPAPAQSTEAMREVGWPWDYGRIRFAVAEEDPQKPWRWEQEVPDRLIVDGQNCRFRPSAFRRPADGPRGNCLVGRVRRSSARVPVGGEGLDRRRIGGSAEEGGEHRTRRRAPGGEACRGAVPGCVGTPSAEVAAALDERAVARRAGTRGAFHVLRASRRSADRRAQGRLVRWPSGHRRTAIRGVPRRRPAVRARRSAWSRGVCSRGRSRADCRPPRARFLRRWPSARRPPAAEKSQPILRSPLPYLDACPLRRAPFAAANANNNQAIRPRLNPC